MQVSFKLNFPPTRPFNAPATANNVPATRETVIHHADKRRACACPWPALAVLSQEHARRTKEKEIWSNVVAYID